MPAKSIPKTAVLVVNSKSRRGAELFDQAERELRNAGIRLLESIALERPAKLVQTVRDSVAKAPLVIVGGGDGTISSVVDEFVDSGTVLAILPFGTANSFARTIGIPLDLTSAIDAIANGKRKRIDLGCIDGDYFANTAVIGLSPLIADTIPPSLKRVAGRVAYPVWALRTAFRFTPFHVVIEADGRRRRYRATEVRIANGRYFGGVELVEGADLDDGQLVVQAVTGKSKLHLAGSWLRALFHLGGSGGEVKQFRGRSFRIETEPRLDVAIDGEPSAKTPVTVQVAPEAVEIAMPKASAND